MKLITAGVLALTLAACGGNSSSDKKKPVEVQTPENQSDVEGVTVVENSPVAPAAETAPEASAPTSPAVGVYLGSCETLGSSAVASGVEITATAILPVTAVFGDKLCAKESLATFGYTGSFENFAAYATYLNAQSQAAGDPVTASFVDTALTFASASGQKLSLVKTDVALVAAKRLKISLLNEVIDPVTKAVSARVVIQNSILAPSQWDLAFYCEKDNKLVRQESSFKSEANVITLNAKLNTWSLNIVSLPTRCQASLTLLHGADGKVRTDIAYSQFLDVK